MVFINSWTRPLSLLHQFQEALLVVMAVCHSASKVNSLGIEAEEERQEQRSILKTDESSNSRFFKDFKKYQQYWKFLGTVG